MTLPVLFGVRVLIFPSSRKMLLAFRAPHFDPINAESFSRAQGVEGFGMAIIPVGFFNSPLTTFPVMCLTTATNPTPHVVARNG